jgi:hypothetical protein
MKKWKELKEACRYEQSSVEGIVDKWKYILRRDSIEII